MTPERIKEIYDDLDGMVVPLDHTPELGGEYFRERMHDCRRKLDWLTDRAVEANRELSGVRRARRAAVALRTIARDSGQATELDEQITRLTGEAEDLRFLGEALEVKRVNLRQTSSDIRLLVKITDDAVRYGGGGESEPTAKGEPVVRPTPRRRKAPAATEVNFAEVVPLCEPAPPPRDLRDVGVSVSVPAGETLDIEAFLKG